MKPIKLATAYVIYNKTNDSEFLIVKRPPNDENLPDTWGLPAGSVRDGETFKESVIRSGKEKLGIALRVSKLIGRGDIEREDYILRMEEYEAEIISGEPRVPQSTSGITQYREWRWGKHSDLKDAADKGSMCSRIYLAQRQKI